jgi:hypothetical protein
MVGRMWGNHVQAISCLCGFASLRLSGSIAVSYIRSIVCELLRDEAELHVASFAK